MLSSFFAIYTHGASLHEGFASPDGADVFMGEMGQLLLPASHDELFGPHAAAFTKGRFKRGFLLGFRKPLRGKSEAFFEQVRKSVLEATAGVEGVGLDVLRLWPFPLAGAEEALPEHLLAEDLFSVAFTDRGEHGLRAETVGLSRLGAREASFEFHGRELMEEATLMCGHLGDWLLEHNKRLAHGQSMALGFDRLTFFAAEGTEAGAFRGWHPPLVQKLIPPELFPGTGVFEVRCAPPGAGEKFHDLTEPLKRSLEQRLLLEEQDLAGDSPHATSTAEVKGFIAGLTSLTAWREEPTSSRDSGWRVHSTTEGGSGELGVMTLVDLARRAPQLIRYFALPSGVKLSWDERGAVTIDRSRVEVDDDGDDE